MKTIVYHHNDNDGRLSAAIVRYKHALNTVEFREVDYGDKIHFDRISQGDKVFVVDFSFPVVKFLELLSVTDNVVWIDHHKTISIIEEELNERGIKIPGLRIRDKNIAACELCWSHLFPYYKMPKVVELVGEYDTWRFEEDSYDSRYFQVSSILEDTNPGSSLWMILLLDEQNRLRNMIDRGEDLWNFRRRMYEEFVDEGCEVVLPGESDKSLYFISCHFKGSHVFCDKIKEYDAVVRGSLKKGKWNFSMYSEKIDVGSICQSLGGGGHTGAAGFESIEFPFVFVKDYL